MTPKPVIQPKRGRFDGMMQIMRYNWPQYAGGFLIALLGAGLWFAHRSPEWLQITLLVIALCAAWWSVASLIASFWIYDASLLYRWTWIPDFLEVAPRHWLNLHAGLDESSPALRRLFPHSEGETRDFFDATQMPEPSIQRARAEQKDHRDGQVNYRQLPFAEGTFDTVFLLFAAHELRHPASREMFMREVVRILSANGQVLLVEHLRDAANFTAFGPGFFHFMPSGEWRRLADFAGLEIIRESRMTPFVKIFLLRKKP